ncbi:MAG: hypothetical protein E6713_13290 [Sporomusaceae bacterium]|nr:hypothetical protein [Sporomusaceae bacterium]
MDKEKESSYYMTKGQKNVAKNMPYCDTPCQKAKEAPQSNHNAKAISRP